MPSTSFTGSDHVLSYIIIIATILSGIYVYRKEPKWLISVWLFFDAVILVGIGNDYANWILLFQQTYTHIIALSLILTFFPIFAIVFRPQTPNKALKYFCYYAISILPIFFIWVGIFHGIHDFDMSGPTQYFKNVWINTCEVFGQWGLICVAFAYFRYKIYKLGRNN